MKYTKKQRKHRALIDKAAESTKHRKKYLARRLGIAENTIYTWYSRGAVPEFYWNKFAAITKGAVKKGDF